VDLAAARGRLLVSAATIISGDADLLVLHPFRGIAIVTPQAFIAPADENA
jgi:predicted nucleic acid-binding protein